MPLGHDMGGADMRPYQVEAVDAVLSHWREWDRELLVMATGTGKTFTARKVIERRLAEGPVLFVAHRDELIEQARSTFGPGTGIVKAADVDIEPVTVGSVQTLTRREPHPGFRTLVIDEAHHACSESYRALLGAYAPQGTKVLGLTATPDRHGLADVFEGVAYEYGIRQAVEDGWLARPTCKTVPLEIDLTGVRLADGDLAVGDLAGALSGYLRGVAEAIHQEAEHRKTLVFCPLVSVAKELRGYLLEEGMDAREVNGKSEDRRETLEWFSEAGPGSVLCNAILLTEGVDIPSTDCVVVLRPTRSRTLYVQMVGRGLRPAPEKSDCLILDFLWISTRNDLCKPASLVSADPEALAPDFEGDVLAGIGAAEDKRRADLAMLLWQNRFRKGVAFDPLAFFTAIGDLGLDSYEPEFPWQMMPATKEQLDAIGRAGMWGLDGITRGQAAVVLDRIRARGRAGLATPKQVKVLARAGYANLDGWTFEQAHRKISEVAANGWRATDPDPMHFTWGAP